MFHERLAGIPLSAWQQFLAIFTETATDETIDAALEKISQRASVVAGDPTQESQLAEKFREIAALLERN